MFINACEKNWEGRPGYEAWLTLLLVSVDAESSVTAYITLNVNFTAKDFVPVVKNTTEVSDCTSTVLVRP